jgi:heptose I phosphotransferase
MWIKQYWIMPKLLQEAGLQSFEDVMHMDGKVFRNVAGRKTIQVNLAGKSYFIKQHFGVGWREIFKNLISLKKPILGAMTEVNAIQRLTEIGIPTTPLAAYGQQGCSPASIRSFIITEDLVDIVSLEDICASWQNNERQIIPPSEQFKQKLMKALAELASKLHGAGLCHRDFYLCHIVLKKQDLENETLNLHLIDLHRMLQGQQPNNSAVMKDVAGLFFSAMQVGWSAEDLALFKQHYLTQSDAFWAQVETRAQTLLTKFNSEKFQSRLAADREKLS